MSKLCLRFLARFYLYFSFYPVVLDNINILLVNKKIQILDNNNIFFIGQ